jgi:hypothetical protein
MSFFIVVQSKSVQSDVYIESDSSYLLMVRCGGAFNLSH